MHIRHFIAGDAQGSLFLAVLDLCFDRCQLDLLDLTLDRLTRLGAQWAVMGAQWTEGASRSGINWVQVVSHQQWTSVDGRFRHGMKRQTSDGIQELHRTSA